MFGCQTLTPATTGYLTSASLHIRSNTGSESNTTLQAGSFWTFARRCDNTFIKLLTLWISHTPRCTPLVNFNKLVQKTSNQKFNHPITSLGVKMLTMTCYVPGSSPAGAFVSFLSTSFAMLSPLSVINVPKYLKR